MAGLDANTIFLPHFNGQNGGKEIVDDGNTGHVFTQNATAQLSTANKKFNSTSLFLDGNSDFVNSPDSPDWSILGNLNETHTIDLWVKNDDLTATVQIINQATTAGSNEWELVYAGLAVGWVFNFSLASVGELSLVSNSLIVDNNFHHVALVFVGDGVNFTVGMYVDGTQVAYDTTTATANFTGDLILGKRSNNTRYFNGYFDEARIQKSNPFSASPNVGLTDTITTPTAPHTSDGNTSLLLHFDSLDVSGDGGSDVYNIPTFNGTAQIDTTDPKFGTGSLFLDGNSDYITVPDDDAFDYDSDFTIDTWFNLDTLPSGSSFHEFYTHETSSVIRFELMIREGGGNIFLTCQIFNPATVVQFSSSAITVSTDEWHHVAFVRNGNDYTIFYDGVSVGTASSSTTVPNFTGDVNIGRRGSNNDGFFHGKIDEMRVSDVARWTSNFTPESSEYSVATPPDPPTSLSATATSQTEIDLSWTAPTGPGGVTVGSYRIERESPEGGGFSVIVADTGDTDTTYSDTGLTGNTEYNYRVSAISTESAVSDPSNEAKDTTDPVIPDAPTSLLGVVGAGEQVILTWVAPVDNGGSAITGYKIERESPTGNGFSILVADTGNTNLTYNDNDVSCGTQYNYRVSAINSVGTSPVSNESGLDVVGSFLAMDMDSNFSDASGIHTPSANGASIDNSVFKTGTGSGKFDGVNDRVFISSVTANGTMDIFDSLVDNVTVSFWVKHNTTSGIDSYLVRGSSVFDTIGSNRWGIGQVGGSGLRWVTSINGGQDVTLASGEISDTDWHHISLIRIADEFGIYFDGTQIYHRTFTGTGTVSSDFRIGYENLQYYLDGNIDDLIMTRSNPLVGSPNVGLTDTITVPLGALGACPGGATPGDTNIKFDKFHKKFRKIKVTNKKYLLDYFTGNHYRKVRGD